MVSSEFCTVKGAVRLMSSGTSFSAAGSGQFRWRFCFASQIVPVVLIIIGSLLIPESPRWLVKAGREDEAYEIIALIRADGDKDHVDAKREYHEIVKVIELEAEHGRTNYLKMFFGVGSGEIHLGRRIQLAFWLQVLSEFEVEERFVESRAVLC